MISLPPISEFPPPPTAPLPLLSELDALSLHPASLSFPLKEITIPFDCQDEALQQKPVNKKNRTQWTKEQIALTEDAQYINNLGGLSDVVSSVYF